MPTVSIENYLKAMLHLQQEKGGRVSTNAIAEKVMSTPASASAMLVKLGDHGWVEHQPYYGARLTDRGHRMAMEILRRHRLWERFLVDHLGFEWDQVHEIAEELEHVDSKELIDRLDAFLGFPKRDPHGDAIPGPNGRFRSVAARTLLAEAPRNLDLVVVGVVDGRDAFLRHLGVLGIELGTQLMVLERHAFDGSLQVRFAGSDDPHLLAPSVCNRLWVDQSNPTPEIVFPDTDSDPSPGLDNLN